MKKLFLLSFSLLVLFASIVGCKKENTRNSIIQGVWELRKVSGNRPVVNYQPGNGYTISFTGNQYEMKENGQVTQTGEFRVVTDLTVSESTCMVIDAGQYTKRIIFDNNISGMKIFFELSGNKLNLLSGCFASDAGSFREYEKQ